MKFATRKFQKDRGEYAELVSVNRQVLSTAEVRHCIDNSFNVARSTVGAKIAFGWLVGAFKTGVGTAIIPHCWNLLADGGHIDTTPFAPNARTDLDYVMDLDVSDLYFDEKAWLLPLTLTLDQRYQIRVTPDEYVDIPDVRIQTLRAYQQE